MKNTLTKDAHFNILCAGEVVRLTLKPATFRRIIDIVDALQIKETEFADVLQKQSPMQTATIAYTLMDEKSKRIISDAKVEIEGDVMQATNIQKLYYMVCENSVEDGLTNQASMMSAVNQAIMSSFPAQDEGKKKALSNPKSFKKLKRFTILLLVNMAATLSISFLMR